MEISEKSKLEQKLDAFCEMHPKFRNKGGLCVALFVTDLVRENGLPIDPVKMRTDEKGQVAGLGRAIVQKVLGRHGITKVLAKEGGRTSRGSMGLMEAYVGFLNREFAGHRDWETIESWWIEQVLGFFSSEGPRFQFDPALSVQANIQALLSGAAKLQKTGQGTNYVGALLQHLIGAKLDVVLGPGKIVHHGFSVADHSTGRSGDFDVHQVAIHVTTAPSEALIQKCDENLRDGTKPIIVTLDSSVAVANGLLKHQQLEDRVDVLGAAQFLTANVYERSVFRAEAWKGTLLDVIGRYNEIVAECETDPALKISVK